MLITSVIINEVAHMLLVGVMTYDWVCVCPLHTKLSTEFWCRFPVFCSPWTAYVALMLFSITVCQMHTRISLAWVLSIVLGTHLIPSLNFNVVRMLQWVHQLRYMAPVVTICGKCCMVPSHSNNLLGRRLHLQTFVHTFTITCFSRQYVFYEQQVLSVAAVSIQ